MQRAESARFPSPDELVIIDEIRSAVIGHVKQLGAVGIFLINDRRYPRPDSCSCTMKSWNANVGLDDGSVVHSSYILHG